MTLSASEYLLTLQQVEMATSLPQYDGRDTPAPPIFIPFRQPVLRNLRLNPHWIIGEPILKENERHAAVYSVLASETGQPAGNLEAHAFVLDGIGPKLRKYRQRCIKRMKGRTELKVNINGTTIVVITTSRTENACALERGAGPRPMSKEGQQATDGDTTSIGKKKEKSQYRLESQRIRQKERRQAERSARTRQHNERTADGGHNGTESIDQVKSLDGKNELSMFVFLLFELVNAWDQSMETRPKYIKLAEDIESGCVYDVNMLRTAVSLQTIEEMESYLKVRRSEIILLQGHQAKISSAEAYHLGKLMSIEQEPGQDKAASPVQKEENSDYMKQSQGDSRYGSDAKVKEQLKLVRLADDIIRNLLISREFIVRLVERKLSSARVEIISHDFREQTEAFECQVSQYKGWISTVVPFPVARADVLRLMESGNIRMAAWENSFLKADL